MEDKLENNRLKYIDYTFKRHGIDPDSIEGQLIYYAYGHGYHQAEKDMELTWDEIYSILYFEREVLREFGNEEHSNEEVCKEVLKRFNDFKERKEECQSQCVTAASIGK